MSTPNGKSTNRIIEERCIQNVSRTVTQLTDCNRHLQQVLADGSRAQIEQALRLWETAQTDANGAVKNYRQYFDIGMNEWLKQETGQ
jgi:hypothetical protein